MLVPGIAAREKSAIRQSRKDARRIAGTAGTVEGAAVAWQRKSQRGLTKAKAAMKKQIKLAALSGIMAFAAAITNHAQSYNVITVANFSLAGVEQNGDAVAPVRIANKDIITALNATGRFSFGSGAQIVMISLQDQLPTFAVQERSGTNVTRTDISSYFNLTESDEIHTPSNQTSYVIQDYHFNNRNGTSFSISGLSTLRRGNISGPGFGPLDRVVRITSQVNGPGSVNGDETLFRGSMSSGSPKAEVAH